MEPMILRTTVAGSLPKPSWLAPTGQLWAPWLLQGDALIEGQRNAVGIALLPGKDVLVGAIDVATKRIETPDQVASTIRAAMNYVAPERLFPCTNCGMVPLARNVAEAKLRALAAGAAIVRREIEHHKGGKQETRS
ncbi:MAG: hypothetical protein A3G25_02865 [Betaproteobacteria bacterium RIFCSPLOWO2_12_FULL_63_13]|nr:MAG: hypothetical protein A3G25_02865 [Betaproteobacteria bacterium RIFCSPLOWO2_12_FULL_63_13]